jgi:predicted dehydrogenase
MSNNLSIAVVGAGNIAREYIKVIQALGHKAIVIGRGEKNIDEVKSIFAGVTASSGGLENYLKTNKTPKYAIVATPIDHLAEATRKLLQVGCKSILVEKPLTYSIEQAEKLAQLAAERQAEVYIAFNRRSYMSVQKARELIKEDGGISSFHFDFTEAIFRINPKNYSKETNRLWGIANSSHIIDTAFYLGGKPARMECRKYGDLIEWHPTGSTFTGLGETEKGLPFTYHANWGCPGKWNIEIMTQERKLILSPMERLHQQIQGSFRVEPVDIDYKVDDDYKPGFYNQVQLWIDGESSLMKLENMAEEISIICQIFRYE